MRIKINGGHDPQSAALVLTQVMAFLQDHHVSELDRINIYVTPKRKNTDPMDFGAGSRHLSRLSAYAELRVIFQAKFA